MTHDAHVHVWCGKRRPFTNRIMKLRDQGARLSDLERRCLEARSTTWFHKLLRSDDPWVVSPPTQFALPGLAALFGTSVASVEAMVAAEWYGVAGIRASEPVLAVATRLDALGPDDLALVGVLVSRLAEARTAISAVPG